MGHFENFLYPFLAANHTKETPKEIEKWALARDWISSLLSDELELETLERDWKIMTPKWSKDITLIFGRLIACEFWNKMDQGEPEFSVEAALVEAQNRYHYGVSKFQGDCANHNDLRLQGSRDKPCVEEDLCDSRKFVPPDRNPKPVSPSCSKHRGNSGILSHRHSAWRVDLADPNR